MEKKNEGKCFRNWATSHVKIFLNPGEGGVKFFALLENIAPSVGDNLKRPPPEQKSSHPNNIRSY